MLSLNKNQLFSKNKLKVFFILVFLVIVITYYRRLQDTEPFNILHEEEESNCHYWKEGDALPAAEDREFLPEPNSIFFHETSCKGGLTYRQACAAESAARTNPNRDIYILFSAPVTEFVIHNSNLAKFQLFPNIKLARVHIQKYTEGTPLEDMIRSRRFHDSKWWIQHTSDILRIVTLYKWGGVYLDTDMIVVKDLTPLRDNWVSRQQPNLLNAAAIAISIDQRGRELVNAMLNELNNDYKPDEWSHNGPEAITRVMNKLCRTHHSSYWSADTCGGIQVYGPEYFFPVHYNKWKLLFEPGEFNETGKYAYHFWNKLSFNMTIQKNSPYMKLAEKYCPTIFYTYRDQFGA